MASGPLSSPPHYLLSSPDQRLVTARILGDGKLTLPEELAFGKLLMEPDFHSRRQTLYGKFVLLYAIQRFQLLLIGFV